MSDEPLSLQVTGDGRARALTEADLTLLLQEADHLKNDAVDALVSRVADSHASRYCVWPGQTPDGRKHSPGPDGRVFPFKGASDARIRLVDFLIGFRTALCLSAATDGTRAVAPMEVTDSGFSGRMQTLLNWVLENQLGETLHQELSRLLSWVEGDTPGAAVLGVYWRRDTGTDVLSVTLEQLIAQVLETGDPSFPVDPEILPEIFQNEQYRGVAEFALANLYPDLSRATLRAAARELRETGTAHFPAPVTRYNGVVLCAHRLWESIFIPANTQKNIQRAACIFTRESLTEVEVRERETTEGWSKDFIATVCGERDHRGHVRGGFIGQSWLDESYTKADSHVSVNGYRISNTNANRGRIEVLTAWYRAINDTGHAAIYCVPFSPLAKLAAKPREVCAYAHGKYPFVFFASEILNDNLLFTRGTAERNHTDQTSLKKLHDGAVNHAEMTALPPFEKNASMGPDVVDLGPLAINPVRSANSIRPIDLPARATGAMEMLDRVDRRTAAYNGIPHPEVPPEVTQVAQQHLVRNFLTSYREALVMILQLCQQYMTAEELAAVTGSRADQSVIPSPESIRARFNLRVSFDPRVLNKEYLVSLMDFAGKIVALDTKGIVLRDRLVALVTRSIDPNLAEYALQPVEQADQQEVEQTKADFSKIMSGVMPEMPEQGVNHQLRLDTLRQLTSANPFLRARITPDSEQMLTQYTDWLEQGITQEDNKVIGRLGTSPELDVEAAAALAGEQGAVA